MTKIRPGVLRRRKEETKPVRIGRVRRFRYRHPHAYQALRNATIAGLAFGGLYASGRLRMAKAVRLGKTVRAVIRGKAPRTVEVTRTDLTEARRLMRSGRNRTWWAKAAGIPVAAGGVLNPAENWNYTRRQKRRLMREEGLS